MEISNNTLLRDEQVTAILVCAVGYNRQGNSVLTSLHVLVRGDQEGIALMTIPKDTRAWVEHYDQDGLLYGGYGSISSVYQEAEPAGLAEQKTVEAVSSLLGGVRLDGYVLLNVVQLKDLAKLAGDTLYLTVEDDISDLGIHRGYQDILPRLSEFASYSYLSDIGGVDYPGTDAYKLARHQLLLTTLMRNLSARMQEQEPEERSALAEDIAACVRTDLQPDAIVQWLTAQETLSFRQTAILQGVDSEIEQETYWIADRVALKDWVMEEFYPAAQEEE